MSIHMTINGVKRLTKGVILSRWRSGYCVNTIITIETYVNEDLLHSHAYMYTCIHIYTCNM